MFVILHPNALPILKRLRDVCHSDIITPCKIRNRARDFDRAVVGAGRERKSLRSLP